MFKVVKYIQNNGEIIKLKNYKINEQGVVLRDNKEVAISYKNKKEKRGYGKFFNYTEQNNKPILLERALASTFDEENYSKGRIARNGKWVDNKMEEVTKKKISSINKNTKKSEETKNKIRKKKQKKVIQYTESGTFVKEWDSALQASKELGIDPGNISKVCRNKRKNAGQYWWQYKVD